MIKTRPKLEFQNTRYERVIAWASILGLIVLFLLPAIRISDIDNMVAIHMGILGNMGNYVNKYFIFLIPLCALLIYVLSRYLTKFPHKLNYIYSITEENAHRQYRNARLGLKIMTLEVIYLLLWLELSSISEALGKEYTLYSIIFIVNLILMILTLIYMIYKMVKLK